MKRYTPLFNLVLALSLSALSFLVFADSTKQTLFKEANKILTEAQEKDAHVLSPASYEKGRKYYDRATDRYEKGRAIESIKSDLNEAIPHFKKAIEDSSLARVTFETALKARNDAKIAEAKAQAPELWQEAEEEFNDAARAMESGRLKRAQSKIPDVIEAYKSAELSAIKSHYLSETRKLIENAEKQKVDRYAPDTFAKAQSLLEKAEKELTDNRYDTDYPRSLAKQAKYEAKHAIYIAEQVIKLDRDNITPEQLILNSEKPLSALASSLDIAAEFDEGYDKPTEQIQSRINQLLTDSYNLGERLTDIEYLEKELALLEKKLGVQSQRIEKQEAQRKRLSDTEDLFASGEALIQTQGQNTVMRLTALNFDPGSATIATRNFNLLNRVQQALRMFSDHHVSVEGHTDSFGSDAANLKLSMDRAYAVREYLLSNLEGINPDDVSAVGYGETRPIANNETKEGRAKNRRIDIVLTPRF